MRSICVIFLLIFLISCKNEEKINYITDPLDYNDYLSTDHRETFENASNEIIFWSKRLKADSSGIGDLGPLANAYTSLFDATGELQYLKDAEGLYEKASLLPSLKKDAHIRSLAHNYISQHRFKEALEILEKSYREVSNKHATELMLFDVYFEIGEYEKAYQLLKNFENENDFSYLIRKAKWNDHKGNIESVLRSMEKAKSIIEARGGQQLQTWTYTNLAIYYGHSGDIKESYNYYLKTLELQPDHSLAKRGIAWIVYSYEKRAEEANRILDSVMIDQRDPSYLLFKSEIAEYDDDIHNSELYKQKFLDALNNNDYGSMYDTDLIRIYAETDPKRGIELANLELKNRNTPLIKSLLAYSQLENGDVDSALNTINMYVKDQSYEPLALYYSAVIYHRNKEDELLTDVIEQLEGSSFELGPIRSQVLKKLK